MTSTAIWQRLLDVRSDDPVRRAINRGFIVVITIFFFISLSLVPVLILSGELLAAAANGVSLCLTFLIWRLTRTGSTYGAILYVGWMIIGLTLFVGAEATTIAAADAAIPLILAFPVVVAAAFIRPAAGLVALVLQMTGVAVVLAASDLPGGDVVRFVAVGSLNLLSLGALVMVGASMCIRAIRAETEANAALRASEERYRTLYEDSPSMLFTIDADGIIVSVNEFGAAQLGYAARELLGASAYDMYAPLDRGRAAGHVLACLRDRGRVFHWEIDKCHKDGAALTVSETAKAVMDSDGSLVVLIVSRDITEQRRAEFERIQLEMELRQAHKLDAIGRLAGGTAHDFNNLLSVISGYTQLLDRQLADHPAHGDIEEMSKAVDSATELTRQLLAYSRRQEVQAQILDLNEIVADMSRLLRRIIGADVLLETVVAPELGRTSADRNQIEQVILNLAVNARDAMPTGGKLILRTANVEITDDAAAEAAGSTLLAFGSYVTLSVSDTGIGMDAETRDRAFEPFFTTKAVGAGTGLGLSTVFGIIEKAAGKIVVSSRPNEGTTFTIYLPQTTERETAPVSTSGAG